RFFTESVRTGAGSASFFLLLLSQPMALALRDTQDRILDFVALPTLARPIKRRAAVTWAQSGTGKLRPGPQKAEPLRLLRFSVESLASTRISPNSASSALTASSLSALVNICSYKASGSAKKALS